MTAAKPKPATSMSRSGRLNQPWMRSPMVRAMPFKSIGRPNRRSGLAVGGAVQQMIKRSLQVGHRAAGLGDKMPSGNGDGESCETDQQQEQQDRQQRARQPGSPGKPIQQRRADIGDDAGDHERQHNEADEIDEERQRGERHDDSADLGGVAQRRGAASALSFPFGSAAFIINSAHSQRPTAMGTGPRIIQKWRGRKSAARAGEYGAIYLYDCVR